MGDQPRVLDEGNSRSSSSAGSSSRSRGERVTSDFDYEKGSIAALASRAAGGRLSTDEVRILQAVPGSSPQFTLAWATVMKQAEVKKDYKGHCEAANKIVEKPRNKYHPEWNLEVAKCQLRNGQLESAIVSVDRTLSDSMSMTGSTKLKRLLLAYEIKARSRTRLYDDHARANSGLGDDQKLNSAIEAWTAFRNYAAGIEDQMSLRKADRELGDLRARQGG